MDQDDRQSSSDLSCRSRMAAWLVRVQICKGDERHRRVNVFCQKLVWQEPSVVETNLDETITFVGAIGRDKKSSFDLPFCFLQVDKLGIAIAYNDHNFRWTPALD